MQTIYLDISNKGVIPTIYAKQGDVGRKFVAVINENALPWIIPNGAAVNVFYQTEKNDNAGSFSSVSISGNQITVTISESMTAVYGYGILCLTIAYGNENEISTWNIPYDIEMKPGVQPINPSVSIFDKAVLYTKQNLTAEQQSEARNNIGAVDAEYVRTATQAYVDDTIPSVAVALATGTAIAKNTDLDIVTEFDNYKCTNSANVKTLLNCPVTVPFIMRVGSPAPGVANYFYQEIITLTGVRFYRYGQPSSGVLRWRNWQKTFDTNLIIPARYGGMGANISSDLGEAAHLDACQKFIDKMNEMAVRIGMTNTTFKTPSGLPRKPVNANKAAFSNEYNSHTTAYDLLRLMVAVKHTPTVLTAMGSARCDYFKNGGGYYVMHSCLGNSDWTAWAEENGYTILAAKGGTLTVEYGEIGSDGILNFAFLIQSGGDVYAVSVVGLNNDEFDVLRTIVRDLISGATNSTAISEANNREYPVGMAVAKLTNGCFDDDITALESGTFYNGNEVRVTASIAKIMTALVATHYMGNYECSVNYDDLVGGAEAITFAVGDIISTPDALSLMMAVSSNTMATMLARVCGNCRLSAYVG